MFELIHFYMYNIIKSKEKYYERSRENQNYFNKKKYEDKGLGRKSWI